MLDLGLPLCLRLSVLVAAILCVVIDALFEQSNAGHLSCIKLAFCGDADFNIVSFYCLVAPAMSKTYCRSSLSHVDSQSPLVLLQLATPNCALPELLKHLSSNHIGR
jgi:hypothetical protein